MFVQRTNGKVTGWGTRPDRGPRHRGPRRHVRPARIAAGDDRPAPRRPGRCAMTDERIGRIGRRWAATVAATQATIAAANVWEPGVYGWKAVT